MLKPSRKNKKSTKQTRATGLNFDLAKIEPMTENQEKVFDLYEKGKNLVLYGSAGSGKSFLSIFLGLHEMMTYGTFNKIVIVRSAVASRDLGFLPGTEKEKVAVYEAPYKCIVNDLYGRDDAYDILKQKDIIQFESTSFLRGLTYNNCLIIVDEIQNLTLHEASTIITRMGDGSKIIFAGDIRQSDLNEKKESSCLSDLLKITQLMEEFDCVEFTVDDIVRSNIVKSFIIAREKLNL